jgi:hypothetical protein
MQNRNADRIAKNLLEGKVCRLCEHSRGKHCVLNIEDRFAFSEEGTCELWEEKDKLTASRIKTLGDDAALLQDVADEIMRQYVKEREKRQNGQENSLEGSQGTSHR